LEEIMQIMQKKWEMKFLTNFQLYL